MIGFHPEALQEAEAARDWYAERSPVASRAFVIELTHAVEQAAESPEMWPQTDLTEGFLLGYTSDIQRS